MTYILPDKLEKEKCIIVSHVAISMNMKGIQIPLKNMHIIPGNPQSNLFLGPSLPNQVPKKIINTPPYFSLTLSVQRNEELHIYTFVK